MTSTHAVMTSLLIPKDRTMSGPCKLKLAILGDKQVGKTSLLTRFVRGMFNPTYIHTAGGDISHKNVDMNGVEIHLTLVDSAGHKYVRSLIKSLYRNVHGIMLVYDVTRVHTFESLNEWLKQIKLVNTEFPFIMLVGNKTDLTTYRDVSSSRAEQYASQKELPSDEVSAKTGENVMEAFTTLIQGTFKAKTPESDYEDFHTETNFTLKSIRLDKEEKTEKKSSRCVPC